MYNLFWINVLSLSVSLHDPPCWSKAANCLPESLVLGGGSFSQQEKLVWELKRWSPCSQQAVWIHRRGFPRQPWRPPSQLMPSALSLHSYASLWTSQVFWLWTSQLSLWPSCQFSLSLGVSSLTLNSCYKPLILIKLYMPYMHKVSFPNRVLADRVTLNLS